MSKTYDTPESTDYQINTLVEPPVFSTPPDWVLSDSWQRAQSQSERGGWINPAERMVWLKDGEQPHRVVFALKDRTLRARCGCGGFKRRGYCAHVAYLWWTWTTETLRVRHLHTGRTYHTPPSWLLIDCSPSDQLDQLSPAELDAYLHCHIGTMGVREFSRRRERAPGTIGNLLSRAREKLDRMREGEL
jgi:hypothetical protein